MSRASTTAAACALALVLPAATAAAGFRVAASQELVRVFGPHPARSAPSLESDVVAVVRSTRPITLTRTVLPVLARALEPGGRAWVRVRLPGRTLGQRSGPRAGWIRAARTLPSSTAWHLVVRRAARTVTVFRAGRRVRRFSAIVGAPSTPTPSGAFFVEENVRLSAGSAGAPFALATSARSSVLQEFAGGPGQIALHGRDQLGGVLGTAVSHGCIRLDNAAITWLAARVGPGVPVTVRSQPDAPGGKDWSA